MEKITVYFEYFSAGETGNDKYLFTSHDEANDKVDELKRAIKVNFEGCTEAETVDEDGFFGIIDHESGDWAKVIVS